MRQATMANLVNQTGSTGIRSIMRCSVCGEEASANRGDYFMVPDKHIFTCHGQPMLLVVKSTRYRHLEEDEAR